MSRTMAGPAGAGTGPRLPGGRPDGPGPARATVAVLLVAVAVVAAALAGPFSPEFRETAPPPPPTSQPDVTPPPLQDPYAELFEQLDGTVEPVDLTWLGITLLVLLVGGLAWAAARLLARAAMRRRGFGDPDDADVLGAALTGDDGVLPDLPTLREGLDDAGHLLATRREPPDAVIAAWVALEGAAARSGVVRGPAQTPTEFTLEVLDRTPADRTATRTLLDLYLRARFGTDPLGADDVATASDAVERLARTLREEEP